MPDVSTRPTLQRNAPGPPNLARLWWLPVVTLLGIWVWHSGAAISRPAVDYSVFYGWVEAGKVARVVIDGSILECDLHAPLDIAGRVTTSFQSVRPDSDEALFPLLHQRNVSIRVTSDDDSLAAKLLLGALPWLLIVGSWLWLSQRTRSVMMEKGTPLDGVLKPKNRKFEKSTAARVTFDDVAGLGAAKRDLQEVVQFLREPERFRRLGGKVPRGVLLVGPPGTGKTLLARAVAGESGVPFFSISAAEFIELFVGVGAARVRGLFEEAKKNAPAIIFIDEIDAVGRSRGSGLGSGHDEREQTLNQLLSEMDGFSRNDLTIVLAATNRPDVLDPALLRPGRFDRRVLVDRPEVSARRAILDVHVRNKPLAKDVDLDAIARNTPGFSGAGLANLVNEAALRATRLGADAISASDFAEAHDKIILGDPREAKLGPEEKERTAVHESGHAVVAQFSPNADLPSRVTIIPRGMALGATQQAPAEDRHILTEPQLDCRLRVLLGGYAAERLVLGSISTGPEHDLKEATKLASRMIAHYGMSKTLGPAYYEHDEEHPFLAGRIAPDGLLSDATIHTIERETRQRLTRAFEEATELIAGHRPALDRLVQSLLEKETIEADELKVLFGAAISPAVANASALAALAELAPR